MRAIFGLQLGAAGTIERGDRTVAIGRRRAAQSVRDRLGYLSEDRAGEGLALPMSVTDNLCATRPALSMRRLGLLDVAAQTAQARRWMTELAIRAPSPGLPVRALSGGNQQKVALGRLLHQQAEVLLLDEPTRGVDVGSKAEIYEIVIARAAAGCAVLIVSSYLPELFGLCDRIAVMCRGRLSDARPVSAWTPEAVMASAVGG